MEINELSEFEIDVEDIMKIYTFPEDESLLLIFTPSEEDCEVLAGDIVFFDMQFYCIEEIKVSSLSWIGIVMTGTGVFMIFCSVLMLPTINFVGLFKKEVEGGE